MIKLDGTKREEIAAAITAAEQQARGGCRAQVWFDSATGDVWVTNHQAGESYEWTEKSATYEMICSFGDWGASKKKQNPYKIIDEWVDQINWLDAQVRPHM